ncbi:hypothetical protein CO101_00035 [Candidatus Berkelbacteria bacterium CG_4_9_14_3_um_filter_39_23]|uniref:Cell division protein FtsL n=2 Tax=Candidatus Berkelbacteria TaxID=1618330 RepID=A0A2M7CHC3_9BACT|nr:MAG: hypothetical protein AUK14_02860 [Candidatus Berkelbacteria bacterium CG2_30_39_44]PIR27937.1 MAG: hypothetical protein COV39_01825 [Candidatus Berkelbacteria bacterium CG11_big_fil_rev_8_21_14_0_20_40_23]PIV25043.1 MAG: hypothetical protein COS38_03755 [Candidatus Berkelbacteria bacterium CG03_land_8_20_14_0_80_40_36]PIX30873.1 MAG: hypothetical protein COZ62_00320 [Candidatus Berkelbacteria bacterium CG_4_8_14_3_um_filter_39_27]PIZ29043.1 MAG: hypothetical protein COY44_00910 [Candida
MAVELASYPSCCWFLTQSIFFKSDLTFIIERFIILKRREMLITQSKTTMPGTRKRTLARVVKIGPLSLKFVTLLIFAAVTLFYLAQTTQSATKTYKIRELRLQKESLQEESKRLEVEAVRLQSLKNISQGLENLGLQKTE